MGAGLAEPINPYPIKASIARRIGSGSEGQAARIRRRSINTVEAMRSNDLTPAQVTVLAEHLRPMLGYLNQPAEHMDQRYSTGFAMAFWSMTGRQCC